ncbi:hypothetical protein BJX63DRAFT_41099 [Aspergillus granulosus]|uniref:Myb-like domain-containing protein n=1 Tax=Aspergillus granulosus TaxID=176169 RepID=A0ABR4GYE3_9EURO
MADASPLSLLERMSPPESIESSPQTRRTWKPWTDEERALLKEHRLILSHLSWNEFAKLNIIPGRSKSSMSIEYGKMEKADNKKRRESKKRRTDNDAPITKLPTAGGKKRPQLSEEIVIDDDEESSPEDGNILYDGQREPLQGYSMSPTDTTRSPNKRQKTTVIPATTALTRPALSQAGQPGTAGYLVPPAPLDSGIPHRPTAHAPAALQTQDTSDQENTYSVPMGDSAATEPLEASPRYEQPSAIRLGQTDRSTVSPVVTNTPVLNEDPAENPAPSFAAACPPPLPSDKQTPPLLNEKQPMSPTSTSTSTATPTPTAGRSSSLPVVHPSISTSNVGVVPGTNVPPPPCATTKLPLLPTHEMTQEGKIVEVCNGLAYLFQTRANDGKRRVADEKVADMHRRNLQQQISGLKQSQQRLEEVIATQNKRFEEVMAVQSKLFEETMVTQNKRLAELAAQNEEKDQKISELEEFRERLIAVITPVPRRTVVGKEQIAT